MKSGAFPFLLAIGLSNGAVATAQTAPSPAERGKQTNMNDMVCEKVEMVGSRLAEKKVCMTRGEWAEQRRIQRLEIERGQVSACMPTQQSGSGARC